MLIKVLKLKFKDRYDSTVVLTVANPKRGITPQSLTNPSTGLLPAAKPVLGVTSLEEAYYLTTNKENLDID